MRRGPTARLPFSSPAQVALAACLTVWLGLLPIAQLLHIGFASHAHRYCKEHHRFEDVPDTELRSAAGYGRGHTQDAHAAAPALFPGSGGERFHHVFCPVLNTVPSPMSSRAPASRLAPEAPASAGEARRQQCAPHPSIPLLLRAPKTPPPCASV